VNESEQEGSNVRVDTGSHHQGTHAQLFIKHWAASAM